MASARDEGTLSYSLFVPEHNQTLGKTVLLTNAIKKAIRKNEFELAFQPQIDARTKQVIGVEALIRWPSSELNRRVSPVEFIPVAEASDLIVEIGDYVIDAAVNQISCWNNQGIKFGKVSINISPRQIMKADFLEKLLEKLRLHRVQAKYIELEITETTVLGNPQRSIEVMKELQNSGFSIAMDDFGTGYSSLEYLKIMPLNKLKIDRAFIKDLDASERDAVIVKMVVAMANALGYQVLAEGVENTKQLKYLENHGCHLIQGYYFAKPMNATELESYLNKELATT
jgi:EAL domain-containing protein (putative c-di-GMP-specific phosphodiesterase class I)